MKTSTAAIVAVLSIAVIGGGIALVMSKQEKKDPREIVTQQLAAGGVWSFSIVQDGKIIYGPDGAFANAEAAHTAGQSWIAGHPVV